MDNNLTGIIIIVGFCLSLSLCSVGKNWERVELAKIECEKDE